jgi:RimJ/RimL family protein N-acetyltransferase
MLRTPPVSWQIPIVETKRLRLRASALADFPSHCALWADPEVMRYLGTQPNTVEESWSRFLRNAGHWTVLGFGSWLVEEKSTGDFVGEVGLFDYHRNIEPPISTPEIGWVLSPDKQGKGYATEAVTAILDWGRERFISIEIACIIAPENTPSLRVAEKCGFTQSHRTVFRGEAVIVLRAALRA